MIGTMADMDEAADDKSSIGNLAGGTTGQAATQKGWEAALKLCDDIMGRIADAETESAKKLRGPRQANLRKEAEMMAVYVRVARARMMAAARLYQSGDILGAKAAIEGKAI